MGLPSLGVLVGSRPTEGHAGLGPSRGQCWAHGVLALSAAHTSLCRDLGERARALAGVAGCVDKDPRAPGSAACSPWAPVTVHSEPREDPTCPQAHRCKAQTAQAQATLHTEATRPTCQLAACVSTCVQPRRVSEVNVWFRDPQAGAELGVPCACSSAAAAVTAGSWESP